MAITDSATGKVIKKYASAEIKELANMEPLW